MSRLYRMTPNTKEREKIIGGVLDIVQLAWLGVGVGIYAVLTLTTATFLHIAAIFIWLPVLFVGVPFAFVKKGDLTLSKYISLKKKYKRSQKVYVNKGNIGLKDVDFSGIERR